MSEAEDTEFRITDTTCHNCYKTFSGKSQLYRHLREVHNQYEGLISCYDIAECIYKCLEGCDVSFRFNRHLRDHLNSCHNFTIVEKTSKFLNFEDFRRWLIQKQESGTCFVKHSGRPSKGSKITYYSCSRTGLSKIKTNDRKRRLKKNGTRKINAGCTSYLKLEENNDHCLATYCDFHYGHEIELEHIPVPLESRAVILDKLANGAELLKIDLKIEDVEFERIQRSDLLTRSDLKNLKNFSKSKKARLALPSLTLENSNDLEQIKSENDDITDCNILLTNKQLQIDKGKSNKQTVQVMEVTGATSTSNIGTKVIYPADSEEVSNSEEDLFGYYVAETLKQIDPKHRLLVKSQISEILGSFIVE